MSNFKYTFFDNQTIGVDQLNEITSRLVTGGISAVYSGADFNVSDINNSNMAVLTGGVVPGSDLNLKVTLISGGSYLINPGVCFFSDGTVMEVLQGGETLSIPAGEKRYVYLTSDKNMMKCYAEVLSAPKQNGVFVLLAEVNADGSVADKRTYARGKIPGFYASSEGLEINVTYQYTDSGFGNTIEIPVGNGVYRHLVIMAKGVPAGSDREDFEGIVYCDFENGNAVNLAGASGSALQTGERVTFLHDNVIGSGSILDGGYIRDGKLVLPVFGSINAGQKVILEFHIW